jgi:hypothetical protein
MNIQIPFSSSAPSQGNKLPSKNHSVWFVYDNSKASQDVLPAYESCKKAYTHITYSSIDFTNELYKPMLESLSVSSAPTFLFWNQTELSQTLAQPSTTQLTSAIKAWN